MFMCEETKELFDVVAKNAILRKQPEELQPPNEFSTNTSPQFFPIQVEFQDPGIPQSMDNDDSSP